MKTKYYEIRASSERKVLGVKENVQVEILAKGFKDKGTYDRLFKQFSLKSYKSGASWYPDFEVIVEYTKAYKTAKLTDFLYFSPHLWGCPFMISKKVCNIFAEYNLTDHNYFPVNLYQRDILIEDLRLFQWKELDYNIIDFSESTFISGHEITNNLKKQTFSSIEEFSNSRYISFLRAEKILLNNNFDTRLDFFELKSVGMFVSERLASKIKAENLTGIKFVDFIECRA